MLPKPEGTLFERIFVALRIEDYAMIGGKFMRKAKHVEASLLMIPLVDFLPSKDYRMRGTVDAVQQRLIRNGLVDRYRTIPDGLPAGWLINNLALHGRYQEAEKLFEQILGMRSDVGLLAEEIRGIPCMSNSAYRMNGCYSSVALISKGA